MALALVVLIVVIVVLVIVIARLAGRDSRDRQAEAQVQAELQRSWEANAQLQQQLAVRRFTDEDVVRNRKQAVRTSRIVVNGKIQEHIAPLLPEFAGRFNLSEARFLGAPVDYIVFEGLDNNDEVARVTFVEIKTGKGVLTKRERWIKKAVEAGEVRFEVLRLDGPANDDENGRYEIEAGNDETVAALAEKPELVIGSHIAPPDKAR